MSASDRPEAKNFAPLMTLSQAWIANLDRMSKAYAPALKGVSRYNLEVARLTAQRGRAWLEMPSTLSRCTSPQELVAEQMRFWQTAGAQYMDSWQRMVAAVSPLALVPGLNGEVARPPAAHDYITVPDAADVTKPRSDRRAA